MTIDAHVHFWQFDPIRDNWINDDMSVIRRDFLPEDIHFVLKENKINGCIAVQADQSEQETNFLLQLAQQTDVIKGIVGWTDLRAANLTDRLSHYKSFDLIKGWRHIVQAEPDGFLLQKDFLNGLSQLKCFDYTYDILIKHTQLPETIKMLDKLPDQPFIIDHCAKPDIRNNELTEWQSNLKILAQHPEVYCKLSGLITEAVWSNWSEEQLVKYLDVVFNTFDISKIVFGSDWPVMLLAGQYQQWKGLVESYMNQFNPKSKKLVFSENAIRFYNL